MRIEQYRRWFEYESDAHAKTIDSLRSIPPDKRRDPAFSKAIGLLGHIAAARMLWLHRFGAIESGPSSFEELFPENLALDEASRRVQEMEKVWSHYLANADEENIARTFEYTSIEGECYRNRIEDLLAQLFGHSFYHRGQIATLVRALGGEPAETDFVFWTRESVSES